VNEWIFLRAGFLAVALLVVAALVGWAVETVRYEDPGLENLRRCLVDNRGAVIRETGDPVARSADVGALETVIETNGVTVSVSRTVGGAERIAARYRSVAGPLGARLEIRGRTVYLWERPPSVSQRQMLFDCTY
jgi:hypothetical protein